MSLSGELPRSKDADMHKDWVMRSQKTLGGSQNLILTTRGAGTLSSGEHSP